jgi:hypothetical protein
VALDEDEDKILPARLQTLGVVLLLALLGMLVPHKGICYIKIHTHTHDIYM